VASKYHLCFLAFAGEVSFFIELVGQWEVLY
jgi:hypothetical protein